MFYTKGTPFRTPPFPFIEADLAQRERGPNGWYTITELQLWNAGRKPLWGAQHNTTVKAAIHIAPTIGDVAVRALFTNDPAARVFLGRVVHRYGGERVIPVYFDVLVPSKGVLIQIWHNHPDGYGLRINAGADQCPNLVVGTNPPIRRKIHIFMSHFTVWTLGPAALLTVYCLIARNWGGAWLAGTYTWTMIGCAYFQKKLQPLAPEDLSVENAKGKMIFYNGPG